MFESRRRTSQDRVAAARRHLVFNEAQIVSATRRFISFRPLAAGAVVLVAVIGASRLFDPFSGDQALFLVGAETLHAGGVLYRDYWDIKQPGFSLSF